MSEENTPTELPTVGGRRIATSNAAFERACLVKLMHEQEKLDCDSSLLNLLCESVRLVREYSDSMQESPSPSVEALEPFVKILECTPASLSDSDSIVYLRGNLTVGDCRRAKETLQRLKEGM